MTRLDVISIDVLLDDLRQLCSFSGSPAQTEELASAAVRIAALMERHGLQSRLVATNGAPVVIGRCAGRSPFTLLLYHHYDVAPPGPWRAWHHEPFQMAERENALYGRGVADGKGPLVAHLAAISALIGADGQLPCNVIVVAEGESLIGSPNLATVIADHQQLLKADGCLATSGERDFHGRPICYSGSKGLLQARLTAVGANQALMPGLAATVGNPLWRLVWALNQVKSDQEEILINEFYDDVESPSRSANQAVRSVHMDEAGRLDAWGVEQFLFSMSGSTLASAEATLPTCNLGWLVVEPSSEVSSIPMVAAAQLDFQLVPRQRPQIVMKLLQAHFQAKNIVDVALDRVPGGYPPMQTAFDHAFVQRVCECGASIYGSPLNRLPLGPFALPLFFFTETFGMPVAVVGCARPDSSIYGPNEHILLDDLVRHGQLLMALLYACADATAPSSGR